VSEKEDRQNIKKPLWARRPKDRHGGGNNELLTKNRSKKKIVMQKKTHQPRQGAEVPVQGEEKRGLPRFAATRKGH